MKISCDSGHKFYYRGKRFSLKCGIALAVTLIWNVMPYSSVVWHQHLEQTFCLRLQGWPSSETFVPVFVTTVRRKPTDSNISKRVFSTHVILMELLC